MNRTPRCPTSGIQLDLCECAQHRKVAPPRRGNPKVPRAKLALKCDGPCGQRRASARLRNVPGLSNTHRLCDECHAVRCEKRASLAGRPVFVRHERNRAAGA